MNMSIDEIKDICVQIAIYHEADLDGVMSAAIVKKVFQRGH